MDPANKQQASQDNLDDDLAATFDSLEADDEISGEELPDDDIELNTSEEESVYENAEHDEKEAIEEGRKDEERDRDDPEWNEPAPERWPADLKSVYNELPISAKKAMLDGIYKPMQRAYGQATQELSSMRKQVEPMLQALHNYRNDFDRMGVDPQQAFQTQMAWAAHFSRVGPEQGLKDMRDAYGFTDQKTTGQEQEEYLTPVERSLKQQVEQLTQMVQGNSQTQQQQLEQARNQKIAEQYRALKNELVAFSNEQKDGKLAHPHMQKVAPAIAGLIRGGMVKPIDDYGNPIPIRAQFAKAYDMAVNLDPSIRSANASGQAARAKAAQKVSVVANNPAGRVDAEELTLDQQLEKEFDRLNNRRSA